MVSGEAASPFPERSGEVGLADSAEPGDVVVDVLEVQRH
jgi:hypothetical protein